MANICFVSTYKPIMCGIADYTYFVTQASPPGRWAVISFDPVEFGAPYVPANGDPGGRVTYSIADRNAYSSGVILDGIRRMGFDNNQCVVWFQHEFGIWPDDSSFIKMLRDLPYPKIVTFHTLHFQSPGTPYGLRRREYEILKEALPHVDAITVFSRGVHQAVTSAFSQYADKIYVLYHGIHQYPNIVSLSRSRAKYEIFDYLENRCGLDVETKKVLRRERLFVDPDVFMIGEAGFLCPLKQSELLFEFRDKLQRIVKEKRIVAVRIGSPREKSHINYARELWKGQDGSNKFLINIWLPPKMLPLTQRAFDLNFYWPRECTQSGVLAHALGCGAIVGGRNMEGTGEMLRASGQISESDLGHLLLKTRDLVLDHEIAHGIEERTLGYADEFSWEKQAMRHFALARNILARTTKHLDATGGSQINGINPSTQLQNVNG